MGNETNLNTAQKNNIFSGKGGKMKEKRGLFNISIVALVVWVSGFSLTPSAMGVESITNINLSPPSPAALLHNETVDITFDYATTQAGGVFIFARPFTNGSRTPNYGAHSSPLYPTGEGGGTGYFTIDTGDVVVDQIRFHMYNADRSVLLLEFFIDVEYHFSSQRVEVPDVVGLPLSQAEQAFWSAGFTTLFEMYAYNDTVPQGHVIGQEPEGGELVPINSSPMIIISRGPDTGETTVEVPDVEGMSESDADSELNSEGLSVGSTSYQYDDTVPDGCVISQSPGAGTEVDPGTEVDLVISMGPEPEDVPPVPVPPVPVPPVPVPPVPVPPVPVPPVPVPPVPVPPDASCLLAHWKLDETSGNTAYNSSGSGNNGILYGNPTWQPTAGMIDGALEFDGYDDYVEVARVVQDDFTLMAWIKTDTPGLSLGAQGYQGSGLIWSDFDGLGNDFILAVLGTKLSFFCGNPDRSINSDRDVVTGEWVHVTATRSAQEGKIGIYINGEHENTLDHANNGPLDALDTIAVGGNVLDSHYYSGLIDDVRFYDCALDENQIKSLISVTPAPEPLSDPLSEALDTSLSFNTGGSADWFSQTEAFYHDGDAAQSGDISGDQESWMQTTVSGKGTVKFYWMVSSEEKYDCLEFYIDGVLQEKISGLEGYWVQKTYTISTSGSHVLEWRYMKDGVTDYGSDCGRVDKVEWVSTP